MLSIGVMAQRDAAQRATEGTLALAVARHTFTATVSTLFLAEPNVTRYLSSFLHHCTSTCWVASGMDSTRVHALTMLTVRHNTFPFL
jgi:hypothetical protein